MIQVSNLKGSQRGGDSQVDIYDDDAMVLRQESPDIPADRKENRRKVSQVITTASNYWATENKKLS